MLIKIENGNIKPNDSTIVTQLNKRIKYITFNYPNSFLKKKKIPIPCKHFSYYPRLNQSNDQALIKSDSNSPSLPNSQVMVLEEHE